MPNLQPSEKLEIWAHRTIFVETNILTFFKLYYLIRPPLLKNKQTNTHTQTKNKKGKRERKKEEERKKRKRAAAEAKGP